MTIDDIDRELTAIREIAALEDFETATFLEHDLWRAVIETIATKPGIDAVALATRAHRSQDIDFPRWWESD